jgi:hypothetical protein
MSWSQLFQYQAHAEPVFVPSGAEDVTLDKWEPRLSQPFPFADDALPTSGIALVEPSLFVVPTVADWLPRQEQPFPSGHEPVLAHYGPSITEPSLFVVPLVADWLPRTDQPYPATDPPPLVSGPTVFEPGLFTVEAVTLDKWFQPASEPAWEAQAAQPTPAVGFIVEPSLFVAPPVLSWYAPASEPRFEAPVSQPTTGMLAIDPTTFPAPPTIDLQWMTPLSQPLFEAVYDAHLFPSLIEPPHIATGGRTGIVMIVPAMVGQVSITSGRMGNVNIG